MNDSYERIRRRLLLQEWHEHVCSIYLYLHDQHAQEWMDREYGESYVLETMSRYLAATEWALLQDEVQWMPSISAMARNLRAPMLAVAKDRRDMLLAELENLCVSYERLVGSFRIDAQGKVLSTPLISFDELSNDFSARISAQWLADLATQAGFQITSIASRFLKADEIGRRMLSLFYDLLGDTGNIIPLERQPWVPKSHWWSYVCSFSSKLQYGEHTHAWHWAEHFFARSLAFKMSKFGITHLHHLNNWLRDYAVEVMVVHLCGFECVRNSNRLKWSKLFKEETHLSEKTGRIWTNVAVWLNADEDREQHVNTLSALWDEHRDEIESNLMLS